MSLPRRYLVPTDFGPMSEKALNYAIDLAQRSDGYVVLLHVIDLPHHLLPEAMSAAFRRLADAAQEGAGRELMKSVENGTNSGAACERIRSHVAKLEDLAPRIIACHVTVDLPHRRQRHRRHFSVRIDLHVPPRRVIVTRDPAVGLHRRDLYATMDEAFADAARQLEELHRKARRFGARAA